MVFSTSASDLNSRNKDRGEMSPDASGGDVLESLLRSSPLRASGVLAKPTSGGVQHSRCTPSRLLMPHQFWNRNADIDRVAFAVLNIGRTKRNG